MEASKDRDALLDDFDHVEDVREEEADGAHEPTSKETAPRRVGDDLSIWECVRAYSPAIFWSLIVSTCVIMEGYDTVLIGNLPNVG